MKKTVLILKELEKSIKKKTSLPIWSPIYNVVFVDDIWAALSSYPNTVLVIDSKDFEYSNLNSL